MPRHPEEEARTALDAAGNLPDEELDLAAVALQFARIDAPTADWHGAARLLSAIAQAAHTAAQESAAEAPEQRRAVLARVLHGRFGLTGDAETYDDLANANLIRVLERRRGLPVALGILWLHAAAAADWAAHGVDFPGHFLVALPGVRSQAVVDVFGGGATLTPPELRALLKRFEGPEAELRPGVLRPLGRREVLLRLQNNIRLRRLRAGDMVGALACTEDALRLAPCHAGLWREAGLMNRRLDRIGAAIACLDRALALEPEGEAARRIRAAADELRQRLN
ncbi:MAG TPA: transglutaminase-like domain-containing protein [Crenalkalicoccus sp.]|jgi:regulator of sirC expression with transglutaminase-like and TPR domain|nr:transglutaminase-like domain-containing protein [Crenalkalicoccus sp.]